MKILVIGATGMLGYQCIEFFLNKNNIKLSCTCRKKNKFLKIVEDQNDIKVYENVDISNFLNVKKIISLIKPDLVINCAGAIKQKSIGLNSIDAININGLFPHRLASLADKFNFKLVLVSTDCVFKGDKGNYTENDPSDCNDIYGKSKYIGEIANNSNVLTIRTSIVGIEYESKLSLLSWFLSQSIEVKGYTKAIYSGVPTTYLADFIYNNFNLKGLYHLSSEPISKYNLLKIFKKYYSHDVKIHVDSSYILDRSLKSERLMNEINFTQPNWNDLVKFLPARRFNLHT